ncbi:Protein STIP1-like protein [Hordeum vulgare]|nr:Protein STIP1-like protein [Hordeum vulgare]
MLNWLPQLTRMVFEGWLDFQDPLFIGHVPLLEAISLTNLGLSYHKIVKLSEFLSGTSIRDLKLGFDSEKIWVQPECPTQCLSSVFRQLRFLNIVNLPEGYDLTWTIYFLEAAPLLKELYITVWDHECKMEMDEDKRKEESYCENKGVGWDSAAADFQHHSLVTLVMFGFESEDCFVSYVRRVLAAAVNLEDCSCIVGWSVTIARTRSLAGSLGSMSLSDLPTTTAVATTAFPATSQQQPPPHLSPSPATLGPAASGPASLAAEPAPVLSQAEMSSAIRDLNLAVSNLRTFLQAPAKKGPSITEPSTLVEESYAEPSSLAPLLPGRLALALPCPAAPRLSPAGLALSLPAASCPSRAPVAASRPS